MARHISDKLKNIFTDTMWSIMGLFLMNIAAQFAVYPYWNRVLGTEAYGNIVYLLGIMNIMAISVGSGVNYTRMRQSAYGQTTNKPYNILMTCGSVAALFVLLFFKVIGMLNVSSLNFVLFSILTVITMWRYYADVEYRLHINYKGFFLYYLVIGIGYLFGIVLFRITGLWPMALLPGEIAGLALVVCRGLIFRRENWIVDNVKMDDVNQLLHISALLIGLNVLSQLLFNGDRIILRLSIGETAVSIFYISSLFGKAMTLVTTPLNGVLVGHLAKYEGKLTKKMMNQITVATVAAVILVTMACVFASVIILPFLYPSEFETVKRYLILANAAQVIFFAGNVIITSIIFIFTPIKNQLVINITHGALFLAMCIPATIIYDIEGFCISLLIVNTLRFVLSLFLGYRNIGDEVRF